MEATLSMGGAVTSKVQSLASKVALWRTLSLNGISVARFATVKRAFIGRAFVLEGGALRSNFAERPRSKRGF
ncbi:hypothetical protein RHIZ404_230367 [Rhizobium sp. EC-SD404]|nr:hypothetical protein RHIZ404_230367 [Rhizobium sp. EC-SD404]